jgi:hypothetical protein
MATKNAISPIKKKRLALLKEMTPGLQAVVKDFEDKNIKAATGPVMIYFDKGARLKKIIEQEATYGSNAVEQLAAYFGKTTKYIYDCRNFAQEWDKEFLKAQLAQPMSDGNLLHFDHFRHLTRVKSTKDQELLLRRVRTECLSTNALDEEISAKFITKNVRSGGRKPVTPSTPHAGLQKAFSQGQQLERYIDVMKSGVFEKIGAMASEKVDDKLLERIEQVEQQFGSLDDSLKAVLTYCAKSKKRVSKILSDKKKKKAGEEVAPKAKTVPKTRQERRDAVNKAMTAEKKKLERKGEKKSPTKKATKKVSKKTTKKKALPKKTVASEAAKRKKATKKKKTVKA